VQDSQKLGISSQKFNNPSAHFIYDEINKKMDGQKQAGARGQE
jgi:hypothetical protein